MNIIQRLESTLKTLEALKGAEVDMYKYQLLTLEIDSIKEVIDELAIGQQLEGVA